MRTTIILLVALLLATPLYAVRYEKVDDKTIKVITEQEIAVKRSDIIRRKKQIENALKDMDNVLKEMNKLNVE